MCLHSSLCVYRGVHADGGVLSSTLPGRPAAARSARDAGTGDHEREACCDHHPARPVGQARAGRPLPEQGKYLITGFLLLFNQTSMIVEGHNIR